MTTLVNSTFASAGRRVPFWRYLLDKLLLPESSKPYGKDEIKAALLRAADELFGLRSPDAVSVRDVAARAGVNHALLHRHFGNKENLLKEVLLDHAVVFRTAASSAESAVQAASHMAAIAAARPAFTKIIAQLLISGHPPAEFVLEDGGVGRLTRRHINETAEDRPSDIAQLEVAVAMSLLFGWTLFSPFLLHAAGYSGSEKDSANFVASAIKTILSKK
ncbi:TetR/AcrR family transcriptional regulator [Pseudomonas veronii]|uniref:helix-turn-helix domain-containing protein n=1 Tax=Pseudomonas veronii TaxID=76761 RepID=UPI0018E7EE5A|nr:TetR/AcrR family transcriptional regulator [Pseudomonas veronii]